MDREKAIETIINDLREYLKRDPQGFWEHVEYTERLYLKGFSDKALADLEGECN